MKKYDIIETTRLFIMQAQTKKAIDELYLFCTQNGITDYLDKIILLSSSLSEVKNSEILGLGSYIEEKNRINLALLQILQKLEEELKNDEKTPITTVANNDRLELIESKIDFLLKHIEVNDDIDFYSFNNSKLWNLLEPSSKEDIINAHIIEKEAKQDNYAEAILLYINTVKNELSYKLFSKFKLRFKDKELDKNALYIEFQGNNKDKLFKYLQGDYPLSLNQISEILLENIFNIDKKHLKGFGLEFFKFFNETYKIRNRGKIIQFLETYSHYKVKQIRTFSQTLIDVVDTKKNIVDFYLSLQPR